MQFIQEMMRANEPYDSVPIRDDHMLAMQGQATQEREQGSPLRNSAHHEWTQ